MFTFLRKILLTAILAAYTSEASAMFIQADWLDPTEPGVGTNRYAYSANDPINKLDPSGNATVVTDKDDNDLFTLDDGRDEITRTTAEDAYKQGIQWFEKDAENYMGLLSVDPEFNTHSGVSILVGMILAVSPIKIDQAFLTDQEELEIGRHPHKEQMVI